MNYFSPCLDSISFDPTKENKLIPDQPLKSIFNLSFLKSVLLEYFQLIIATPIFEKG